MLTRFADKRPLVVGHRGAQADAPMNTLAAFELALDQGADGIEFDVQLSKDGHPVILHDRTVDATTDGQGRVQDLMLSELRELDAGSWFSDTFIGVHVPTLDEVLDSFGHKMLCNIEIKAFSLNTAQITEVVAAAIARHDLADHVLVSSFNPRALLQVRRHLPDVALGFLYARATPKVLRWLASRWHFHALHPEADLAEPPLFQKAASKYMVNVWTVNDATEARRFADLGAAMLITDHPGVIRRALGD